MKLSATLILASCVSASASSIRSASANAALLSQARRLEQQGDDAANQITFLQNYKAKMIGCATGVTATNPENGETEYSSVIFRLCPADSCDDNSATGCKTGYGDYIVGLNTFVQAWLEDKRDDMYVDDSFKVDEFGECKEYKADNNNGNNNNGNDAVYYVGPACDEVTGTIKLGLFSEYTCVTPASETFEEISNGWTLPFSSGGLVTSSCEACVSYNDNGALEATEVCGNLYQFSGKCETNMETSSTKVETACSTIEPLLPKKSSSSAGAAVGWTIFVLVIVGAAAYGYTKWWVAKKQGSSMSSGGVLN